MKRFNWAKPDRHSFHRYFGEKYVYAFKDKMFLVKSKLAPETLAVALKCKDLKTAKEISVLLEK